MPTPKWNLKILRDYMVGDPISSHHAMCCYPAMKHGTDEKYMLKVIPVPESQKQLEALLLTGALADRKAAKEYYASRARALQEQVDILRNLSEHDGFLPYVDSQVVAMEEQTGYEVFLLGSYKRSLSQIFGSGLTHADALNMGLDLCGALSACRRAGYVYADLKPGNIFLDSIRGYCIGDIGFIALSSLKYTSLPNRYRCEYTAPELADDFAVVNATVDIYALGLVLYQAFNGGTLPFEGTAPNEELPCAMYADYELAAIIGKACHPDPAQRFQEPTQMAQALIQYMQTYGCPETPIAPPVIDIAQEETTVEEFLPEMDAAQLQQEMDALALEQADELAFMSALVSDETAPTEESAAEVSDTVLTEELSAMLAQADDLISHTLPDPVVAPAPIEVPMPEPIVLEPEEIPVPQPQAVEETVEDVQEEVFVPVDNVAEEVPDAEEAVDAQQDEPAKKRKLRIPWRFVILGVVLLALLALAQYGQYYYDHIYTQKIEAISVEYEKETAVVSVQSDIDPSKLTVTCTDSYGNAMESPLKNGTATFTGLKPSTRYTVRVKIKGQHRLIGATSDSFTTDAHAQILSFIASIGPEDCSVNLNFTFDGREAENWTIRYSADGIPQQQHTFSGRNTVIYGLTAGCEYTFTICSQEDLYVTGQTQVTYLATNILYAQELTITACGGGELTASWQQPQEQNVTEWFVRCYNENGYNMTVTTSDLTYTFTGLDHSTACTVEVTAMGMSKSVSTTIEADPLTVQNFSCSFTEEMVLQLQWDFLGTAPEDGWILHYTINGGQTVTLETAEPKASILAVADGVYDFIIEAADGRVVFQHQQNHTVTDVAVFANYGLTLSDMEIFMCLLPEDQNVDWAELPQENLRTEFTYGEQACILLSLLADRAVSENQVHVQFVLYDSKGLPIRLDSATMVWNGMWRDGYCCLQIPALPEVPGTYYVGIYFDGAQICVQEFAII